MLIDLKPIFIGDVKEIPVDFFLETEFSKSVHVTGKIAGRAGIVTISAAADFTYIAPCDRCAVPTTREFSVPIEHTIVTSLNDDENDELLLVADMKLDVSDLARTDVLLYMPIKYICKDDCKGLCPMCGTNLNDGTCSCSDKQIDPRLLALKELID